MKINYISNKFNNTINNAFKKNKKENYNQQSYLNEITDISLISGLVFYLPQELKKIKNTHPHKKLVLQCLQLVVSEY